MKNDVLAILLLSLCLLSACSDAKTQKLEAFFKDANIEHVDKVIIQDGSTGYSKEMVDEQQIDDFLSRVKYIEYSPQENQEGSVGWRYAITLIDGQTEFKFTLHQIGDTYYDTNPDIHPIVDTYYKELEREEK
ncbi:hypothetical protein QT711_08665 [Sporosarcina saromensis]|uniref:Lipoprotein n=1 Tax=Sporosarcina saromensis TaxID=359365 RepID=A0ABU4G8F2_9BACL|nr:hypothetical protein [Sporosarcina saromensis]MDW0113259.1 hypothetical protein [Sporosarcina saromensis]